LLCVKTKMFGVSTEDFPGETAARFYKTVFRFEGR